jgi:hypothetical protein
MMKMKKIKTIIAVCCAVGFMAAISGCELAGLSMQKDYNRVTNVDTVNAHLNMDAFSYLKSRAYGSTKDTIFRRMYDAIIYSGIDTNEYKKPNRTFVFFTNAAVTTSKTGLWTVAFTSANKAAKKWSDYPAADVKNYLLYHILTAQYSHYNLPVYDVNATTLAPAGAYTSNSTTFVIPGFLTNPTSIMRIKVANASPSNTSDYPLVINDTYNVATSDLLATNGVVQVVSAPIFPNLP